MEEPGFGGYPHFGRKTACSGALIVGDRAAFKKGPGVAGCAEILENIVLTGVAVI
jgi:hypothetical protein